MCLSRVDVIYNEPICSNYKIGYKHFKLENNGKRKSVYHKYKSKDKALRINRWIHDNKDIRISANNFTYSISQDFKVICTEQYYPSGFHLFQTYDDAFSYMNDETSILEIRYKNIIATGFERNIKTIIAKSIYIPGNQKNLYVPHSYRTRKC